MSSADIKATTPNAWLSIVLIAISVSIVTGCAAAGYGRLYQDAEVTRLFTSNSVPDDYRYYTNGRTHMPYAIIGIDQRYSINLKIWEPVLPNTDAFAKKVLFIWRPDVLESFNTAQGAWIVAPDGEKIGIWYSMYPYTTIKMQEDNQVMIFSPFKPNRE